jgi:DNA primase catalytic core
VFLFWLPFIFLPYPPLIKNINFRRADMDITKAELDAIKRSNDLVSIIQSRGIKLKKKGKNYVGLCPFHKENTPSFTVDPVKQLWNCFGCPSNGKGSTGGDVIGFIVKYDNISFREAVERLKKEGSGIFQGSEHLQNSKPGIREDTKPDILSPKKQKLLNRAIQYYQTTLLEDTRGIDYLQKERGIMDRQSILDFGAGFASGRLLEILPPEGELIEDLKSIGILNDKGNELFSGSVVFPLFDSNNNAVSIYGRRIEDGDIRHLYLPGKKRGLINWQAAKRSKSLILAESVIDALSLYDAGFKHVIPCYGTNGLIEDHLFLFSRYNTKEIYLCFDSDPSGKEASIKTADQLKEKGISVHIIDLPEKDINDYFKRHTPEEFEGLIKKANPHSCHRSGKAKKPLETIFTPTDHGFIIGYGQRRYEVKGISRMGTQLKATIKAYKNKASSHPRFELSTIDLYSNRSREWFARLCVSIFDEHESLLKEDLNRILEKVESYQPPSEQKRKPELTEGEKKEALEFLENPDLFDQILADLEACGHTGEDTNKLLCYIASVSRKIDDPISILIQSRSAAGKSSLQEAILALVPEEDYVLYTRITDQALFYKEEDSLVHKILAIEEAEGMGGAAYSIRNIQSSKSLSIACTGKDPVTGKQRTQEHKVKGPVMVMLTTTRPDIDEETASRFICISIDETREMTERIHKIQREEDTLQGLLRRIKKERIIRKHQNAQRLLNPLYVVNPYSPYLSFPTYTLRSRRDHKKYLNLIKAIAFIHQYQREKKGISQDGEIIDYIEVTLEDIEYANRIANEILGRSLDEISSPARNLLDLIHKMVKERANGDKSYTFRRREIREYTGWSDWQVKHYIKELEDMEYLYSKAGNKGKEYVYELNYNGQGEDGKKFYLGLTRVDEIKKRFNLEAKKTELEVKSTTRRVHGGH